MNARQHDPAVCSGLHLPGHPPYLLRITCRMGYRKTEDPYAFDSRLGDMDIICSAKAPSGLAQRFGAQLVEVEGVKGVRSACGRQCPAGNLWWVSSTAGTAVGHPWRPHPIAGLWERVFNPAPWGRVRCTSNENSRQSGRTALRADPLRTGPSIAAGYGFRLVAPKVGL